MNNKVKEGNGQRIVTKRSLKETDWSSNADLAALMEDPYPGHFARRPRQLLDAAADRPASRPQVPRKASAPPPLQTGAALFMAKEAGVSRSGRERKRPKR